MRENKKRWGTTAVIAVSTGGCLLGIYADAPKFIADLSAQAPEWFFQPKFWWTVGFVIFDAIAIAWIWRGNETRKEYDEDDFFVKMLKAAGKKFPGMDGIRLVELLHDADIIKRELMGPGPIKVEFVRNHLLVVLPEKIERVVGKRVRNRFDELMRETGEKTNDVTTACIVSVEYLETKVVDMLIDLEKVVDETPWYRNLFINR